MTLASALTVCLELVPSIPKVTDLGIVRLTEYPCPEVNDVLVLVSLLYVTTA